MAKQSRQSLARVRQEAIKAPTDTEPPQNKGKKLLGDMDELLDEIDGVLEVNAKEFVKGYIQKGGQ